MSKAMLRNITEQLTAMGESLDRGATCNALTNTERILLRSAAAAIGVAINCINLYLEPAN